VTKNVDMKYTLSVHQENVSVKIPVTLSVRLLDEAEAEKYVQERQKAVEDARAKLAEAAKPKPLDAGGLDEALADLRSGSGSQLREAVRRLANAVPVENRRAEVAKTLEPLLTNQDHFVRVPAAKALAAWGTKDNVPALIAALGDRDVFMRNAAMTGLGNPRTREPLSRPHGS
jgi:HEAT repeat protein